MINANEDKQHERDKKDAENWREIDDPMSQRSLDVVKRLSAQAGENHKIVEALKKLSPEIIAIAESLDDFESGNSIKEKLQKILEVDI